MFKKEVEVIATYEQLAAEVRRRDRRYVKPCWIADVKELNGLSPRRAPNRFPGKRRTNPCPNWARPLIERAMRRNGMI